MKQGLLLVCLVFLFMSFGQAFKESKGESDKWKSNSSTVLKDSLVIEQISNKQGVKVKRISRPKKSEKKQITTPKNEESKN